MARFDKLLVLDLDETLVHATAQPERVGRAPEHLVGPYALYRRPHLDEFLAHVFADFEAVGIWTSSTPMYANQVVKWLGVRDQLRFLWASDRCTRAFDPETMTRTSIKPLQKLVRAWHVPKEKVLFVDDSPEKIQRSYGNYIRVQAFEGSLDDDELVWLARYLQRLGPVPNVRTIEKRGWRGNLEREG